MANDAVSSLTVNEAYLLRVESQWLQSVKQLSCKPIFYDHEYRFKLVIDEVSGSGGLLPFLDDDLECWSCVGRPSFDHFNHEPELLLLKVVEVLEDLEGVDSDSTQQTVVDSAYLIEGVLISEIFVNVFMPKWLLIWAP